MKLHVLVGQIEAHLGRELTTLQNLKLKDWYFLNEPTFYIDNANGKVLWINTKNKTYTLASLAYIVLEASGFFEK